MTEKTNNSFAPSSDGADTFKPGDTFVPNPRDFAMPKWLVRSKLNASAKVLYMALTVCAGRNNFCYPSQENLSKCLSDCCIKTVQRHLKTLVSYGLIRIDKRKVHGTMRTVYFFLNHAEMNFEKKQPKATPQAPCNVTAEAAGAATNLPCEGDKSYQEEHDIFEPPLNMYKGYQNTINHPLPPADPADKEPLPQPLSSEGEVYFREIKDLERHSKEEALLQPAYSEGEIYFSGEEDLKSDPKEENPLWSRIKESLRPLLRDSGIKTWIEPLNFEFKADEVQPVLRFPNPFFMTWVQKHYKEALDEAFRTEGLSAPEFAIFTESQLEAMKKRQAEEFQAAMARRDAERASRKAKEPDVDALPPYEQFDLLYAAYPEARREAKHLASKTFFRLFRNKGFTKFSDLLNAVKRNCAKESWQREDGRYAPQLHRWLSEKRWLD